MAHYAIGDRVRQAQYGDGTVSSVNTYHIKIDFDEHGVRTFATDRVVLTASSTGAPVKTVVRRKRAPRATAAATQTPA
jgi:hypothetical protein